MSEPTSALASFYLLLMLAGAAPTAIAETADVLVDPTRPRGWQAPVAQAEGRGEPAAMTLKLQGTFRAAGRRSAVINGQRVAVDIRRAAPVQRYRVGHQDRLVRSGIGDRRVVDRIHDQIEAQRIGCGGTVAGLDRDLGLTRLIRGEL